jgi:histidinol-phosphatase
MSGPDLVRAMATARRAVEAASRASLRHWRTALTVERKADQTPVTVADRESEGAILEVLREDFPGDSILTEESGALGSGSESRWIVDPLDGTKGFSRGGSFWGPLVALEHQGEIVAGALALPALGETYWAARGQGAFRDGKAVRVSAVASWGEATLSLGEIRGLIDRAPAAIELAKTAFSTRCYGDLAGCVQLLNGQAEAWIEAGVKVWDLAPLKILVEEAGGRFTDFAGTPTIGAGEVVASNGPLHEHVLHALAGK